MDGIIIYQTYYTGRAQLWKCYEVIERATVEWKTNSLQKWCRLCSRMIKALPHKILYLQSYASWLSPLQVPHLHHLQGGPLPPPIAARLAHQTSPHCSSSSATPSASMSGMYEGLYCTLSQCSARSQVSAAEQYQCSSNFQQLHSAHFEHQRDHPQDLKWTVKQCL